MSNYLNTAAFIFDSWVAEREQLEAVASALLNALEPDDHKNPTERDNITAWRLS